MDSKAIDRKQDKYFSASESERPGQRAGRAMEAAAKEKLIKLYTERAASGVCIFTGKPHN